MSISLLLEMATTADPERVAVVSGDTRLTVQQLSTLADGGAHTVRSCGAKHVAYVGTGGEMLPLLLFSSARADVPITPLNFRLSATALREMVSRLPEPMIVVDSEYLGVVRDVDATVMPSDEFAAAAGAGGAAPSVDAAPDSVAVVLFTSGTTSRPKAVQLTHNNLTSYVTGTVEFSSARTDDAALICVPPYHVAGVGAALSNLYAGRRMVYQRHFDPDEWLNLVNQQGITTATVVPTMLDRIVSALERNPVDLPSLRSLAYGGAKTPLPLLRKALRLFPQVGFVNAYGLTETSSTIAILGPDEHRAALNSTDPRVRRRLGSVGRPVPGVEIQIRGRDGAVMDAGQTGELYVRGPQISGRYAEIGSVLDAEGWFATKDLAMVDDADYLFIGGRSDDTIIRGGENVAPAEIEEILLEHPHVRDVAVVGPEDPEWGQLILAVVVPPDGVDVEPEELRAHVRSRLRGSRTPDRIMIRDELPYTATGKVLRRELIADYLSQLSEPNQNHGAAV